MPMGGHAAPPVRRAPSPPALSTFILALVAFIFSHAAVSSVADDNSNASLLKFKKSLINADALKDWQPSADPCTSRWSGIICMDGQVWALQLENLQLSGQIDVDSLVSLPMLRSLSFINNNFQGPMPDWKKLGALKSLFISGNHFSGEIPGDTFEGMSYLKKVHMANNELRGPIPSSLSTPRLLELAIENNQFTGPIPDLRDGIKAFNASNNQLEGPIPKSLEKLDPSSFSGNKGLCGKPLGADCKSEPDKDIPNSPDSVSSPSPPPPQSPSEAASKSKTPILKIVILVMAIVVSLALIFLILLAYLRSRRKKTGRILQTTAYNQSNQSLPSTSYEVEAPPPVIVGGPVARKPDNGKLSFVREDRERFDLQDLLRASAEVLGSGNFGSSYKALLMDGKAVVVKRFKQMTNVDREDFHEHMRRLGRLDHPNVLPLVAYYYRKEEKLLVYDHLKNGSLASSLHGKHSANKPFLDWPKRLKIMKGVSKGLLYLQTELPSVVVAHGHLKSSNVLLDDDFHALLMDYALLPVVNIKHVHQLLVSYKSPEYTQTGRLSKKTDVWCLGILILEILTGKIPPNYVIGGGAVYDSVLAQWVKSIVSGENEEVFDPEMIGAENSIGEMKKLLTIGAACCEEDVEKRWHLSLVVERLEEVKEKEN